MHRGSLVLLTGKDVSLSAFHRNPFIRRTQGWQVLPVFQVYQHGDYRYVLDELVGFFGCGTVRP